MIRHAVEADKMRVLTMCKAFHAASGIALPFSAAMADSLFRASLADDDRLCLIFEEEGVARGVLAAVASPHHLAPVQMASELVWWIDPAWRGRSALKMLSAYEAWARERRCAYISMVGLGRYPAPAELYERQGYEPVEVHFLKSL
ncbi:GNAT family N-acetyltransferase [Agrobacterium rhizogenes]|uniref:GNAT family N-acetyltransferase n=1 Tax=Rhizobium rhizogenes TaxID=359 RepID=UPI0015743C6F|nr:GNAT family N-acetyltransferase [Rhizobium rhizogenes]NTG48963.1 GNAT family N-acetyltransferase [Rhizobium rhizogenes]